MSETKTNTGSELSADQLGQLSGGTKKNPPIAQQGNAGVVNVVDAGGADEFGSNDTTAHKLKVT